MGSFEWENFDQLIKIINNCSNINHLLSESILSLQFDWDNWDLEKLSYLSKEYISADPQFFFEWEEITIFDIWKHTIFEYDQQLSKDMIRNIAITLVAFYKLKEKNELKIKQYQILQWVTMDFNTFCIPWISKTDLQNIRSQFKVWNEKCLWTWLNIIRLHNIDGSVPTLPNWNNILTQEELIKANLFLKLDSYISISQKLSEEVINYTISVYGNNRLTFWREYKEYKALEYQYWWQKPEESVYNEWWHIQANNTNKIITIRKLFHALKKIWLTPDNAYEVLKISSKLDILEWDIVEIMQSICLWKDNKEESNKTETFLSSLHDTNVSNELVKEKSMHLFNEASQINGVIQNLVHRKIKHKKNQFQWVTSSRTEWEEISDLFENLSILLWPSKFKHYIRHIETIWDKKEEMLIEVLNQYLIQNTDYEWSWIIDHKLKDSLESIIESILQLKGSKSDIFDIIEYYRPTEKDNNTFTLEWKLEHDYLLLSLDTINLQIRTGNSIRAQATASYYEDYLYTNNWIKYDADLNNPNKSPISRYYKKRTKKEVRTWFDLLSNKSSENAYLKRFRFENHPIKWINELNFTHWSTIKTQLEVFWIHDKGEKTLWFWQTKTIRYIWNERVKSWELQLNYRKPLDTFLTTLLGISFRDTDWRVDLIILEEKLASSLFQMEAKDRDSTISLIVQESVTYYGVWSIEVKYLIRLLLYIFEGYSYYIKLINDNYK
jgi:hypothetical protein